MNVTALLIAITVIVVLIALMSKQQALIETLKHQSYLEDNILATESRINQFKIQIENSPFPEAIPYTGLKLELQVTFQGISEYMRNHENLDVVPTALSQEEFLSAQESLNSASARHITTTTLDLLYTLIKVPVADATQYIQLHFSLLPMFKEIQAEENALLLRIQSLHYKMLLTTVLGAIFTVVWYLIVWLFKKCNKQ